MPDAIRRHVPAFLRSKGRTLAERQGNRTLALNGAAWQRLRTMVLNEQPLCADCLKAGKMTSAVDVDHKDNDASNNERSNLVGLCHSCHSRKTAVDMGKRPTYGCDINGVPLDPAHPWRIEVEKSPATEGHGPTVPLRAHRRDSEF